MSKETILIKKLKTIAALYGNITSNSGIMTINCSLLIVAINYCIDAFIKIDNTMLLSTIASMDVLDVSIA